MIDPDTWGADVRAAQKELAATERRMQKLQQDAAARRDRLADHDQADYVGLGEKMAEIQAIESEVSALEDRWLELSEQIG